MKLIFEKSKEGFNKETVPQPALRDQVSLDVPEQFLRTNLPLPQVPEVEVVRHYVELSTRNYGIDTGFYPLGSCTMKHNPRINEDMARLPGFAQIHPYQPNIQGAVEMMGELAHDLAEITGMDAVTLQPAAGAHGELTGLLLINAYHKDRGEKRNKIIVPDASHGTNPASATMGGFATIVIQSTPEGEVDLGQLEAALDSDVAGLMLTNPNTLGLFDRNILEITKKVHAAGGLCYYDGANLNPMIGVCRPGDMGFDVVHVNLHKSFSTPHGGGGPGAGPVGVKDILEPFLPVPVITGTPGEYSLDYDRAKTIGRVRSFYGNFGVLVRAYTYIKTLGAAGLRRVGEISTLNANYMRVRLQDEYELPMQRTCCHEFVLSDAKMPNHVTTLDIAKRLLDFKVHAPTIYFPLIVHGALMIEPTETESVERMDQYIDALQQIKKEAEEDPEMVTTAPHTTVVTRLDEVQAARKPVLKFSL
ncbi:MAG TPA: aminomethyl-transferring glycine dehydrogenase subunit GcvPB [Candidatus Lokiarchaeia archaeon]|nr:aminomethyl-transferring glycine dehydrogenase subunit GcvPB [Candidatus Lokiarchaeia archaeon]